MTERSSSKLGMKPRFSSWPTALIGIVVIKAVLSLAVRPGSALLSYSGISYFLLLLLAASFAIRNGIQKTLGSRPFWVFLAIADGLWALSQCVSLYYELGLHIEVPNNSIADPVLFLHIVPLMAAVATLPHRNLPDRKLYRAILNSLLLLFVWSFLYGYTVFPYSFSNATSPSYALRFDTLYLLENLALVLAVGILTLRVQAPWKSIYFHLLGASTLYALSSIVANLAIDSGGYVNGKLYGLGLTAAVCWFAWIPLRARQIPGTEVRANRSDSSQGSQASVWAMVAIVMISIPIVWELFQRNETTGMRTVRLLVAIATIMCLASAAYMKEYLAKRELASHLGLANDRLRMAMEAGASVGWDLEVKSGRDLWFGALQTIFGIPSDTFVASLDDFIGYVHRDDRQKVSEALADARENRKLYAAEFRVVRPDGTIRWLVARGTFYYATNGEPLRMLGVSLDITERKLAEEKLREYEKAVEGSEEMIAVVNREYRYLIANRQFLNYRSMTKDQVVGRLAPDVLNKGVFEGVVKEKLDECFRGKVVRYEMRYTYPQLGERDLFISNFPIEGSAGVDRVACILQDITERKRTEEALRKSEERFRLAAQAGRMFAYEWDAATDMIVRSAESAQILGIDEAAPLTGQQAVARVHPDDRERLEAAMAELSPEKPNLQVSYRVVRPDGTMIWVERNSRAHFDEQGTMLRIVGMVADITERKRAEEAVANVSRRVIEAEEQERTRIATTLHEDIGQRLALLAIEIEQLKTDPRNQTFELLDRMDAVWKQTLEILTDVKASAHELHSPRLEYLGIAAVMRSFCKEFSERKRVEIDFRNHHLPSLMLPDVSICLFRVLQEALYNGVKHSGVQQFEVQLWGTADEIHLTVSDSGAGFELETAKKGQGLGLMRMEERLKLVKGTFAIDAQPKRGTTIHACVPRSTTGDFMHTAG